ncbi:MAG: hypothetical protein CVU11_08895 [Bacteroidetes bacterium HGW-Bacteroidetes-6]|jgi:hypothetical protein|nr:MAG: hypothetical protein CVU11_08895 [Bacteroidetes bacterium HGW-Bacteroidetes-6]
MKQILLITLFFWSATVSQAQIDFTASADYSSIPLNGKVNITFSLKGANAEIFSKPSFDGFRVISQQSYTGGGNMQVIINNQIVSNNNGESKWIFTLVPKAAGSYSVGPAKVKVSGQWYSSNQVTVKVTAGGAAVSNGNATANRNVQPGQQSAATSTDKNAVFIRAIPSKTHVYLGEQFTVSYRIYTQYDISQYGVDKTPGMDGFWIEELTDPTKNAKTWEETVDGKPYMVGEFRVVSLIAQKTGLLTIPSLDIEAIVRVPNQQMSNPFSVFDQFFKDPFGSSNSNPFAGFGSTTEKRTLASNPVEMVVSDLPAAGQPERFSGAVGNFQVSAELDRNKCFTGDGVTLKISVSGAGNLPLLEWPEPEWPAGFEVFDPDITDSFDKTATGIQGTRTFEFLLQPSVPGDYKINPGIFSSFDPVTGRYNSFNLPDVELKVLQGSGTRVSSEKKVADDILHIHESVSGLQDNEHRFGFSGIYWGLIGFLFFVFGALLYYFRSRIQLRADVAGFRMRMAMKQARKRLRLAGNSLAKNDTSGFYTELSKALWLYLNEKFTVPFSELSHNNAREILRRSNVPDVVADDFAIILDECDYARFAPDAGRMNMSDLYRKSTDLIIKVQTHSTKSV